MKPIHEIVHAYPRRIFKREFVELLLEIDAIENEIHVDLIDRFREYIEEANGSFYGQSFQFNETNFMFHFVSDIAARRITIAISRTRHTKDIKTLESLKELSEFGPVSGIYVRYPETLQRILLPWLDDSVSILQGAYRSLENAFVTKYLKWRFSLLDEIYSITNTHLKLTNSQDFIGRYWFSISTLKTNRFRYHLDRKAIESAIDWFKSQKTDICGLHAIVSLILEEPEDGIFASKDLFTDPQKVDDKTFILQFSKLPHIRDRADFASAEHELYASDKMACIELVTTNDLSLQLNCPHEEFQHYQAALDSASADIKSMFLEHQSKHEKDLRQMETALAGIRAKFGSSIRQFTIDLTAKVIKELSGP
jgi:hypothetical protein